jgi:hypothetical protein
VSKGNESHKIATCDAIHFFKRDSKACQYCSFVHWIIWKSSSLTIEAAQACCEACLYSKFAIRYLFGKVDPAAPRYALQTDGQSCTSKASGSTPMPTCGCKVCSHELPRKLVRLVAKSNSGCPARRTFEIVCKIASSPHGKFGTLQLWWSACWCRLFVAVEYAESMDSRAFM